MKLADRFSTMWPGIVAKTPPSVSAGYTSGTELARVNTRPMLHFLEAMIDSDLTNAEHIEAVSLLKAFNYEEQRKLLQDKTLPARAYASELTGEEMLEGMSTWTTTSPSRWISWTTTPGSPGARSTTPPSGR